MGELQGVRMHGSFLQNVALRADVAGQRHDQFLADGIDGRIGDLGEELLEVMEEGLRLVTQAGKRRVGAHGANGLLAVGGHGSHQEADVFLCVSEGALARENRFVVGGLDAVGLIQMVHQDLVLLDPFAIGLAGGERGLEFFVGDDALLGEVHQQHFAGLQAAFRFDVLRPDGQHAGFRCHDELAIMRLEPAGRAQAIAV